MTTHQLNLTVESKEGGSALVFSVQRLVCAGWVGRDKAALQAHVKELEELGIPGPGKTPIHMNFAPHLVRSEERVHVVSGETSGEVEYVILRQGGQTYVGVGSDHTDRGFERHSIPASKQMYPKVLAPVVWPYEEVRDHWDAVLIRSWMTKDGERQLYQEDALAEIMDAQELLEAMPKDDGLPGDGLVMFSGTVASKMGMVYGERFDFEMEDPQRGRKLAHGYDVQILPQYT